MYKFRREKLLSHMKEHGVEMAIITSNINIYYFTGYYSNPRERLTALILDASGESTLLVPSLDKLAGELADVRKVLDYQDHEDPFVIIQSLLKSSKVALEENQFSLHRFKKLSEHVSPIESTDIGPWIDAIRKIKDADEIVKVKQAIDITEEALEYGISLVSPKITEKDLALEIEYKMKKLGAQKLGFDVKVISGKRSALPHGKPGTLPIEENAFVLFDMGVSVGGYIADISRTVVLGEPTEKMIHIYETVREALEKAINAVKPGVVISDLDRIAREHIEQQGFGQYFIHRLGHGLGLDLHEYPSIHANNSDKLEQGMVFTIEPGIYIPEIGGVRIEDDVLVTENGVEVLTKADKRLRVIGGNQSK
ncbi:Xaa-Pro peptidase family protein [Lederbergia citrisecunda]|uniref:M24 family metallopeptidase n=1 Tax=Lederbergia citrisecunda TaxID=2833583 RepID=UPI003D2CEFB2